MVKTIENLDKLEKAENRRKTNFGLLSVGAVGGANSYIQRMIAEQEQSPGRRRSSSRARESLKGISKDTKELRDSQLKDIHNIKRESIAEESSSSSSNKDPQDDLK